MTLQELMDHFFRLYGRRNRIFLSGLRDRIDFLNLAIGDLQEAIRKEASPANKEIALARVVARIFCIAENFLEFPLVETMSQKYPEGKCSYCQQMPCQCQERRPQAKLASNPPDRQFYWSLKDWCNHLDTVYGAKNKERGVEITLNRLFKEVGEILSLQMMIAKEEQSLDEIEKEFALELADCLAWTIAISNFLGLNLGKAVSNRFGSGCWKCGRIPCNCTRFDMMPVKWSEDTEKTAWNEKKD